MLHSQPSSLFPSMPQKPTPVVLLPTPLHFGPLDYHTSMTLHLRPHGSRLQILLSTPLSRLFSPDSTDRTTACTASSRGLLALHSIAPPCPLSARPNLLPLSHTMLVYPILMMPLFRLFIGLTILWWRTLRTFTAMIPPGP